MKFKIYSTSMFFVLIISCQSAYNSKEDKTGPHDRLLGSVLWFQHSAEMTALFYQGFNIATQRLDEAIKANKQKKPLAVVVDIDETFLNNSPYDASLILNTKNPLDWKSWTTKASAKPLPGAMEFAKYAESKNVEIFYITNRDDNERMATLKNLSQEGFPYATEGHLLTKSDSGSKAGRRAKVSEYCEIILFIGDNLNDFSEIFEDRSVNDGKQAVDKNRAEFGKRFIILPNPIYGAWEKPLYDYTDTLSDKDKIRKLKSKLILN